MSSILRFIKKEPVLTAAAAAALLSMLAVPPGPAYLRYVDLRVLCLLFCLMAVVAGLQDSGLFTVLAQRLLSGRHRLRTLGLLLVGLPFLTSMLVTNDVALLTFVPFAIFTLRLVGRMELLPRIVVLQTVAANLGSMATPVGNPQNLFLYTHFGIPAGEFFAAMVPLTLLSLAGLAAAAFFLVPREVIHVTFGAPAQLRRERLGVCAALFGLCLLSVFRVLPYGALTVAVAAVLAGMDRKLLARVDYGLLLTFVCFFIFSGNLGSIPAVREGLSALLGNSTLLSSVLASQVISNVPAATLLAGFTLDWRGLLVGTNVGGLGTLIASLASLISFKLYAALPGARPARYLGLFTAVNLAALAVLLPAALWLG